MDGAKLHRPNSSQHSDLQTVFLYFFSYPYLIAKDTDITGFTGADLIDCIGYGRGTTLRLSLVLLSSPSCAAKNEEEVNQWCWFPKEKEGDSIIGTDSQYLQ